MEKSAQYIAINLNNAGLERGMEEAHVIAPEEKEQMRSLADKLAKDGRNMDIKAALSNEDYKTALLSEYHIKDVNKENPSSPSS